jgi:hypothetical protein
MTFDLLLVEQTAVKDPVVIVPNSNVTRLRLNLGEGGRERDNIRLAILVPSTYLRPRLTSDPWMFGREAVV